MNQIIEAFSNPENVARYTDGPIRMVPGYAGMQQMAMLLLAERVPVNGRVLVLGAGGGLELKAFAEAQPDWTFDATTSGRSPADRLDEHRAPELLDE